jgi:uncharacterized protein YdeI (BOF family)
MLFKHRQITAAAGLGALLATTAPIAQDPYGAEDDAWISISGTVSSVSEDRFTLDYGDGAIYVDMDDGDRDADAYRLLPGDHVGVAGRIDKGLLEATTLAAASVYVEKLGTTFYSDPYDEEDVLVAIAAPVVLSGTTVRGTVMSVGDDRIELRTAAGPLTLNTEPLPYDPLDNVGYPQIDVGDRVRATGVMSDGFFSGPKLDVHALTMVRDSRGR